MRAVPSSGANWLHLNAVSLHERITAACRLEPQLEKARPQAASWALLVVAEPRRFEHVAVNATVPVAGMKFQVREGRQGRKNAFCSSLIDTC
jgi:hypothetical protein